MENITESHGYEQTQNTHKMRKSLSLSAHMLMALLLVCACNARAPKYIIGISQCSEDSWRAKLQDELTIATYFNEGVELRFTSAHDDSGLQESQIDSLVKSGIDLLIVSPNQVENLSNAINKTHELGIPIVLYDRKTKDEKCTAFMGADNNLIGEMLAQYVAAKLGGKGNIVEIGGLEGSSPAQERHDGFVGALKKYPDIHIVGYESGDWTEASGEDAMRKILKHYDGRIDAVFGGNDRMAIGARRVVKEYGRDDGQVLYLGVDALPTANGGIRQVADSLLTASAIYPTHGDELLQLALDILNGKSVPRETLMKSSLVTGENAKVLLLQHEEVVRQTNYLRKMHTQARNMHENIRNQQAVIGVVLTLILVIAVCLGLTIKAYKEKHRLNAQLSSANTQLSAANEQLSTTNEQLMHEKEVAERQRDELEEQRDKVIEISLKQKGEDPDAPGDDIIDGGEKHYRRENEFYNRFLSVVHEHLANSDLSVEDIGEKMCLSRVQLYRKVKALTGKSPVEIIREERLHRGHQLLTDSSLNISEIAYKVGFSSPSYFTKCYKDYYGVAPSNI